jgi:hypothetical protein
MVKDFLIPDYIFETSWEVCNKVGGIYTVLSTCANTLQNRFRDKVFFIGPDIWSGNDNPLFDEKDNMFASWREEAFVKEHLKVRIGRWNVPGYPLVILVDFNTFFSQKDDIYTDMWVHYQVDSLHAYGDYDEASMFSYAAAKTVESFYRYYLSDNDKVIYQAHEWMTGMGALYLKYAVPEIATIFTTHATSIGRSIAGNQKPLYDYLFAYNGDQMAHELNIESKHSIEKQTAHNVDCFTTVSEITNRECRALLDKSVDVILMNGFESDFVPQGTAFEGKRKRARQTLLRTANALMGTSLDDRTLIIGTSGRYEFKNKGIDVFIDSLSRLNASADLKRSILAYINVPGWYVGPRNDLQERLGSKDKFTAPLSAPFITHWLHDETGDQIVGMLRSKNLTNAPESKVKVVFVPCYLNGKDGVMNKNYYDLLLGQDLSVYASYYEPWGYTPLESIAFHVPTVTTDLSGFGLWVKGLKDVKGIDDGVEVLHRSDYNYFDVVDGIKHSVLYFSERTDEEVSEIRLKTKVIVEKALWKHFIEYYFKAYDVALQRAQERQ